METPAQPPPGSRAIRSVLLAIAGTWFLILAFARIDGDPAAGLVSLVQAFAFGIALIAIALVDWRKFRLWFLLVAILVVAVVWMATGHPLLFLVGM